MVLKIEGVDIAETFGIAVYPLVRGYLASYLGAWGPMADVTVILLGQWLKKQGGTVGKVAEGLMKGAIATLIYSLVRVFMRPATGVAAAAATFGGAYGRRMYALAPALRWRGRRIIV